MIKSLCLIFGCLFLGEAVSSLLHLPVPGNVIGMVLLTAALSAGVVQPESVKPAADVLLKHMAFLFVPPGVGLMVYLDLLGREFVAVAVSLVASTLAVLAVVGLLQQRLESRHD